MANIPKETNTFISSERPGERLRRSLTKSVSRRRELCQFVGKKNDAKDTEKRKTNNQLRTKSAYVIRIEVYDRVLCRDRLRADVVIEEQFSFSRFLSVRL